jgi:hypothetical protein
VGIGDATVPEPEWLEYPSLLNFPKPRVKAYRPETAIAEKLHAMVELQEANSRMKDFFDIHVLASRRTFERHVLTAAIANTFARRRTPVPESPPIAFTTAFASIPGKNAQWNAFNRRLIAGTPTPTLIDVISLIATFATPLFEDVARGDTQLGRWKPGGPWD